MLYNCSLTQNCTNVAGPTFTNTYDAMGRILGMSRTDFADTVADSAVYNPADQLLSLTAYDSLNGEQRGYNALNQLISLRYGQE